MKINSVIAKTKWYILQRETNKYPYVTITTHTRSMEPEQSLIDDGWTPGGFSHYEGEYSYSKRVDIRTVVDGIVFRFTKKTDDRDYATFGFCEEQMDGAIKYAVPQEMLEEVAQAVFNLSAQSGDYQWIELPEPLRSKLITWAQDHILEDEFNELRKFATLHKEALMNALNPELSEKEQKKALLEAHRIAVSKCPALVLVSDNRMDQVIEGDFRDSKVC